MTGPRPTSRPAAAAVLVLALAGCTSGDGSAVLDALPSTPICQPGETPDSCVEGIRLSLQSAFAGVAERGTVTRADHERILLSVVSQDRLGNAFSYALLTEPGDVGDAVGTWWLCPQDGRVSTATCDEQR